MELAWLQENLGALQFEAGREDWLKKIEKFTAGALVGFLIYFFDADQP